MRNQKNIIASLVILLLLLSSLALAAEPATHSQQPMNDVYYIGAYLYTDRFAAAAKEQDREMFDLFDEHFARLAGVGVNIVHITIHDPALFDRYVELAEKHDIKLLPELDFAYFRLHWSDEEMQENARKAIDFLAQWHDAPQVLAWSVKEEPYDADIARLDEYYRLIIKGVPDVKFFMVTSGGGWLTANAADLPFALVGGDYYYFSWEQGLAEKALARWPDLALKESRETTELYRRASEKFNAPRIHVFGAAACTIPDRAQGFATGTGLPEAWTPEQKNVYMDKVRQLAERGQDGWSVYHDVPEKQGPQYNLWTLYMPPANCKRALIWGGILEGANVTMCFSYNPYSKTYNPDSVLDSIVEHRTERFSMDLAGRPDRPNPHFDEFAKTVAKVRSFDQILSNLKILPTAPLDGEAGDNIHVRAFEMNGGYEGQVLIVHNANVGHILCPDCEKQSLKSCQHVFIDDAGDLKYFHPQEKTDTARLVLAQEHRQAKIFDIVTGKALSRNGNSYTVDIGPGDAAVLYVGDQITAAKIHQLYRPFTPSDGHAVATD